MTPQDTVILKLILTNPRTSCFKMLYGALKSQKAKIIALKLRADARKQEADRKSSV